MNTIKFTGFLLFSQKNKNHEQSFLFELFIEFAIIKDLA